MVTLFDNSTQVVLEELEKTQKEFWNIDRGTANFLNMLIKAVNAKKALELGTSNGYSGIWLAKALKETGGKLTTIEFWEKRLCVARENFKIASVDDIIETHVGSACEILAQIQNRGALFDFVFIDANKSEYIKYFNLIHPMLKSGGIIAADNILSHAQKVEPYVNAISNHPDYQTELIIFPAGLLLSRKN